MAKLTDHQAEEWYRDQLADAYFSDLIFFGALADAMDRGEMTGMEAAAKFMAMQKYGTDMGDAAVICGDHYNPAGIRVKGVG